MLQGYICSMVYIISIGVFQSLLMLVLLRNNKYKKPVDFLISGLLLFIFLHLAIKFVIYANINTGALKKGFNTFIDLAYGPLLFMIAKKLKADNYKPSKHWYLFMPCLVAACFYFGIVGLTIFAGKVPPGLMAWYNSVTIGMILPLMFGFSIAAYNMRDDSPDFRRAEKKLIKTVAALFIIISLLIIPGIFFLITGNEAGLISLTEVTRPLTYGLLVLVCVAILRYFIHSQAEADMAGSEDRALTAAHTLFQERILVNNLLVNESMAENSWESKNVQNVKIKVPDMDHIDGPEPENHGRQGKVIEEIQFRESKKNVLSTRQQHSVLEKLENAMSEKKIYRNPDLNLAGLSEITKISRHHISEILNQHAGKSFYSFINEYRIEEVLTILNKCRDNNIRPDILPIAFEVGFNSKSSFNLYFKKHTGISPSEYIKLGKQIANCRSASPERKIISA